IDVDFRRTQILFGELADEVIGKREVPQLTLEEVEVANRRLLAAGAGIQGRCEFVSGDWSYMQEAIESHGRQNTFDLILTSETIYDTASYRKLHDLIAASLAKASQANGRPPMALVAAKSIYFGLTGSVLSFKKYVQARGVFVAETVWQSGGSMNREILRLTWA
ncbi:Histidine protein methyltransferase 1, partial [Linderina pennispora]